MKMKISKGLWLAIAAGIFIVVLATLGTAYLGQTREQAQLRDDLALAQKKLAIFSPEKLSAQLSDLEEQSSRLDTQITSSKKQLSPSIISTDIGDALFEIAETTNVNLAGISSTGQKSLDIEEVPAYALPMTIAVEGQVPYIYNFIVKLSDRFPTARVESVDMTIPDKEPESPIASIELNIYTYKGG